VTREVRKSNSPPDGLKVRSGDASDVEKRRPEKADHTRKGKIVLWVKGRNVDVFGQERGKKES